MMDKTSICFVVGLLPYGYFNVGNNNTGLGKLTRWWQNTTGTNNVAYGNIALDVNTTGAYNAAIGVGALSATTVNFGSTAIGYNTLHNQNNGGFNTSSWL
jgi:hypothetical protein